MSASTPLDLDMSAFLPRPLVLVFLPNTNELQRFVLSGALSELKDAYKLRFVCPSADVEAILSAAPQLISRDNLDVLDIPPERFKVWVKIFEASCYTHAERSRSFALRIAKPANAAGAQSSFFQGVREISRRHLAPLLRRTGLEERSRRDQPDQGEEKIEAFLRSPRFLELVEEKGKRAAALLESLMPYRPLVKLLDRYDPLFSVIPTSLLDVYCNDLIMAGRASQHVVLLLQSGWDNLSSKGILHQTPDHVGVWGPQSRMHAKSIQGLAKSKPTPLGAPHYEALRPISAEARTEFRRRLGAAPEDRLILFGGSFRQFDETSVLRRLDEAITRGDLGAVRVIYRPHPWRADRTDEDDFFQQEWRNILFDPDMKDRYLQSKAEPGFIKRAAPMYDMEYLAALLSSVDAVMTPMSTLLLESIIMDKPTLAIAFGDGKHAYHPGLSAKMTHFEGLESSDALIWCDDERQFEIKAKVLAGQCGTPVNPKARLRLLNAVLERDASTTYAQRLLAHCRETVEVSALRTRHRRRAARRGHISQAYGALAITKRYCGIDKAAKVEIPGYWMHGWIPAYHNVHPALIALHKEPGQGVDHDFLSQIEHDKAEVIQWVSRRDQKDYLKRHGYRHVHAIGLPFGYLPEDRVARVPGSLLVMPPHGHDSHGPDDPLAREYAAQIALKSKAFSEIYVCLAADDYARNQWRRAFEEHGIPVITGADQADPNTLRRLKRLFGRFEFVTTNGFGSHIAAAAAAGAKPSVFGPYAEFPLPRIRLTHAVKMYPELAGTAFDLVDAPALKAAYPFLFVQPEEASDLTEWGLNELGTDNVLDPEELKTAFGWRAEQGRHADASTTGARRIR